MSRHRIFADFNNADRNGRVRLNTHGALDDIARNGIHIAEGMTVLLDDYEGIQSTGIVRWDEHEGWVAEVDWSEIE
jgi:hypothetical protein